MTYGRARPGRLLAAVALSVLAYLWLEVWIVFLIVPWLLGVVFRLVDLRVLGLRRVEFTWLMSSWTWVFDFALRGYFRAGPTEPRIL